MPDRQALRHHFRAQRRALSKNAQNQHALAIACTLQAWPELRRARNIGLYRAIDGEVDLTELAVELARAGKQLALPVVGAQKQMRFHAYRPGDTLVANRYQIPEPVAAAEHIEGRRLDILLVPLVAFDTAGNRLGMGAGYYDRYLSTLAAKPPRTIGVAHETQRSEIPLPVDSWDISLDRIVTEGGWQVGD
jgi:5-formyltetrahydrofolate cyclo-ligase